MGIAADEYMVSHPVMTESELERRAELDQLLGKAKEEYERKKREDQTPLAALLGHYEPIEGHSGFFARAPRLRQQIEIAKMSEQASESSTISANLLDTAKMARLAVFKSADGQIVPVELDEFLDEFDGNETVGFLTKYMGMKTEATSDPNA